MPANFPAEVTRPLGRLNAITQGATSFASDLVSLLTAAFGSDNPFGSASTRNTGTAEGEVPVLTTGGRLDPSLIPSATDTASGGVILARNINDARADVVATAAQVAAFAATAGTGLSASNLDVTNIASGVDFTAPAIGLIVVAAAGGGGHRPPADRLQYLSDGLGADAGDSYLWFGSRTSTTSRLTVRGGTGGARRRTNQISVNGLSFPAIPTGANPPDFAIVLGRKGAPGGEGGVYTGSGISYAGVPGGDGELLIAKVPAATYRVTLGNAGAGGAALTGLGSGVTSTAGGAGYSGFAFYIRLI